MTDILDTDKQRDVLALGRLGWTLRRIQTATGVRRETAAAYLKAASITVRAPRRCQLPANPASEMSTDPVALPLGIPGPLLWPPTAGRAPQASTCEPYRELIALALDRGRNAVAIWQDLVDDYGFPGGAPASAASWASSVPRRRPTRIR